MLHLENWSLEVLFSHLPSVAVRPPSAVNDPSETKQIELLKAIFEGFSPMWHVVGRQGRGGACGRMGGHCPNCVVRGHGSPWILGR